jgi:hypothetical protein
MSRDEDQAQSWNGSQCLVYDDQPQVGHLEHVDDQPQVGHLETSGQEDQPQIHTVG